MLQAVTANRHTPVVTRSHRHPTNWSLVRFKPEVEAMMLHSSDRLDDPMWSTIASEILAERREEQEFEWMGLTTNALRSDRIRLTESHKAELLSVFDTAQLCTCRDQRVYVRLSALTNIYKSHRYSRATQGYIASCFELAPRIIVDTADGEHYVSEVLNWVHFSGHASHCTYVLWNEVCTYKVLVDTLRRRKASQPQTVSSKFVFDLEQLKGVAGVYFVVFGTVRQLYKSLLLKEHGFSRTLHGHLVIGKLGASADLYQRCHKTLKEQYHMFFPGVTTIQFRCARPLKTTETSAAKLRALAETCETWLKGALIPKYWFPYWRGRLYGELLIFDPANEADIVQDYDELPDHLFEFD